MKSKLYRVLVLLVAIAMMIPSFAFAEDAAKTPTFTLTGADTPIEVKMGDAIVTTGITWEVKDLPTGSALQNAKILWTVTSDNNSTFSLSKTEDNLTTDVSGQPVPTVTNSNFKKDKEDVTDSTATITGKLVVNSKDIASKSFTVKVSKVDVTSIDFKDTTKQTKTTASAGKSVDLTANGNIDLVVPEKCSFKINDVVFSVVSGGDYANITSKGSLYINSNTPNDTKIKVRAYIPGSKVAGYAASKAEIEITVVGQYEPEDPQVAAEDAYTFIGFTVDKDTGNVYTIDAGDDDYSNPVFYFINYLTALGNTTGTDVLVWQVDDPTKATLAQETTTNAYNTLTFKKTDVAAKVKVTVRSKSEPTVTDYCYVQFVPKEKKEEDKGYTKLAFQPYTEVTVVEPGDPTTAVSLLDYLVRKKAENSQDILIWQNDKKLSITQGKPNYWVPPQGPNAGYWATGDEGGAITGLKAELSPVTVTVKSKLNGTPSTIKINVVKSVTPEDTYSKVEFAVNSVETTTSSIDILPFLKLEGDGDLSQLIFTSSDPDVAYLDRWSESDQVRVVFYKDPLKDGDKVTIEVRNGYSGTTTEPSKLEVIYVKNPEEDPATYKIGFTKKSLDVPLSAGGIYLGDYVYVQDKDGNKIPTDEARNVINRLIWNTDNAAVATVGGGWVGFKKAGTATISMRTGYSVEKAETITLNIKKDEEIVKDLIKGIKFNTDKEIEVLERYSINAFDYLIFTDMDGKEVTDPTMRNTIKRLLNWTSTDQTVASVDDAGYVYANKEGSTTINVRYNNGQEKQTASLKIKVVKAESKTYTKVKFAEPNPLEVHIDEQHYTFDASKYLALEGKGSPTDLKWSSSDEKIAKVDENGIVCFGEEVTEGTATLWAKDGDSVKITVTCPDADPALEPATLTLNIKYEIKPYTELKFVLDEVTVAGNIDNLNSYLVTKGNEFNQDELIWTSSNQQIAKVKMEIEAVDGVDNSWTVAKLIWGEDVQDGDKVVISVRSKLNKDDKASAKITLIFDDKRVAIQEMELTQAEFELDADDAVKTFYLDRYVKTTPAEHDDKLIFTSDDPSVVITKNKATVKIDAKLMGEEGTAHITVRSMLNPDATAQFTFKVKRVAATSIKFLDAPTNFYPEEKKDDTLKTLKLKDYLVIKPADFDKANLVWESSDPTVAKVDNDGVVTYVQAGKVTITATDKVGGKSDKVVLTLGEKHPVKSIALKDITMDADDTYELNDFLTFEPLDAKLDESRLTFTSSNREVAEVIDPKKTGITEEDRRDITRGPKLVAYKAGTTKITAYYELEDGSSLKATATVTVEDIELEKVKISEDKYTLKLNTKVSALVRFNVEPYNCSFEPADLYVVSADPEIVEVSPITYGDKESHKGMFTITGKKPGTAWVVVKRAKDDKALDACKVKVKAVAVKSVGWEKKNVKMYYYDDGRDKDPTAVIKVVQAPNTVYKNTLKVTPIINPAKAYCNVSFETSDPSVAFINDKKVVDFLNNETPFVELICMGPGKCKITMKVDDGKKVRKAVMNVEVLTKLPKLKLSEKRATLKLEKGKDTLQLRAYDANTDADLEVKWASSNTKVAKVNVDGKVRAVGEGTATISATTKNGQKQVVKCKIVVKAPSTKNVAAKKITGDTKVTVKAGEKKALEIKVKPEGAKVTFTSSDPEIVKVTKDGKIKGIKAGKATITVKAAEGKAELKIKVVVK